MPEANSRNLHTFSRRGDKKATRPRKATADRARSKESAPATARGARKKQKDSPANSAERSAFASACYALAMRGLELTWAGGEYRVHTGTASCCLVNVDAVAQLVRALGGKPTDPARGLHG